jgi:hypothetical protein
VQAKRPAPHVKALTADDGLTAPEAEALAERIAAETV